MEKPRNTYSNHASIENTDTVIGYDGTQTIYTMVNKGEI